MTGEEFAGKYATEAVESGVHDRDGEVVGHVGLLDVDDVTVEEATQAAERLPGVAAVLRTSEEAFHVWSLAVEDLDAWLEWAGALDVVDEEHVALSKSRECSVVRIDAKVRIEDGEVVKPAPSLVHLIDGSTDRPLSRPHGRVLCEEFGGDLDVDDGRAWVGHSTRRRSYLADIGGRDRGER